MSNEIAILNGQQVIPAPPTAQWHRVTFAGLTPGNPPHVVLHAVGTTHTGAIRHFSQTAQVVDETVALRLMKLSVGVEIRVCTETDWAASDLAVTLKDFCRIEAIQTLASAQQEPTT